MWKTILGVSSEGYEFFVPGDWLNPLGMGMVMFALGSYPGKEWDFFSAMVGSPCADWVTAVAPQRQLSSLQHHSQPRTHQGISPSSKLPTQQCQSSFLSRRFWVFLLQTSTPSLCLSALTTTLKGSCPWACLWKDMSQLQAELAFACNLYQVGERNVGAALAICDCSTVRWVLAFPRKGDHIQNKTWIITNSGHI